LGSPCRKNMSTPPARKLNVGCQEVHGMCVLTLWSRTRSQALPLIA
jgi:hypothetical protein